MKIFSYIKSIPSLIILLQHLFQIRSLIEDFPCNLRVGDNLSVAIVLQGTGTDIQPLAHFLTRKEKFSGKDRLVRFCHFHNSFFTPLSAETTSCISSLSMFKSFAISIIYCCF